MKYRLTETKEINGVTLHQIECIEPFGDVKQGDKGGWIEKENNLSQFGDAWVYGNARVYGKAMVYGNACVFGDARVSGNAWVGGKARVYGDALVYGDAEVYGNACVFGNARVSGKAEVSGDARVYGDALVYEYALVYEKAEVSGDAEVYGNARVSGNAEVSGKEDYIVFKNNWSSGRYFTWTRSNNMWKVGCFYGTGEELIAKAYKDSKLSGDCYKATVEYVEKLNNIINNN